MPIIPHVRRGRSRQWRRRGVCALGALVWRTPFEAAFAGAIAAASADTWATEIGTLSPANPVSIATLRPVQTGMSGGVSILGIAASAAERSALRPLRGLFA